jgi:hypothetical protein
MSLIYGRGPAVGLPESNGAIGSLIIMNQSINAWSELITGANQIDWTV